MKIQITESRYKKLFKSLNENTKILENSNVSDLNEDELLWRHYSAIQCFLNRKRN